MAIFEDNKAAKIFSIFYLLTFVFGTLIISIVQIQYTPEKKMMISFDAGTYKTKGILYEVQLEHNNGIMPINTLTKCEINQGIHESIIPLESKEDEWNINFPLNIEEEKKNENADDNEITNELNQSNNDKNIELHKIITLKSFDEIDTKPTIPNEKHNKLTINKLSKQLGDCFETMLINLTDIYLRNPKSLNQGVSMFLGATAGMRMLQIEDKLENSLRSQLIMMHIRNEFQHRLSQMSRHWPTIQNYFHTRIGVISGKEEAISSWINLSYLIRKSYADSDLNIFKPGIYDALNLFDKGSFNLIDTQIVNEGAIEIIRKTGVVYLGGTSFRITFPLANNKNLNKTMEKYQDDIDELSIMNVKYQVYGQSLICFGLEQIWNRLLLLLINNSNRPIIEHPCLNNDIQFNRTVDQLTSLLCLRSAKNRTFRKFEYSNYQFNGKFNSEKCYQLINYLIDYEECSKQFMFCANSNLLPPAHNLTFIATSKLYHLTRVFGKKIVNISYNNYIKGMNNWCKNDLTTVLNRDIMVYKHSIQYCFGLHYVESIFINLFQIAKEDFVHINFIDKLINQEQIEWSLGYLIGNLDLKAKQSLSSYFSKLNNIFLLLLSFSPIFIFYSFKEEVKHLFNVIKFKYFIN